MTPARLGPNQARDLVASLFNGAARFTRGLVTTRRIAHDTVLPFRHGLSDLIEARRGRGVIEVVLRTHATK